MIRMGLWQWMSCWLLLSGSLITASATEVNFSGSARFRGELRDNSDFNSTVKDTTDFIGSRIRLEVLAKPITELEVFIQPQFSNVWGQVEGATNAAGVASGNLFTSGALRDPQLSLHQGYALWRPIQQLEFKIGRQEIAYGEHIVLGNVGFSNIGRSFDAVMIRGCWPGCNEGATVTDFIAARLAEDDFNSSSLGGDADLFGAYTSWKVPAPLKALDTYLLYLLDDRLGTPTNFNFVTLGGRLSHQIGIWYGRAEANFEIGQHLGADMLAYMLDIEQGVKLDWRSGFTCGVGYNHASGDDPSSSDFTRYHQLFPTAHRHLGWMDFFGRQNLQSGFLKAVLDLTSEWQLASYLHSFWRVRSSDLLYSIATEVPIAGQPNPPTNSGGHAGEEVDLLLGWKPHKNIQLELFSGLFFPGNYLKRAIGNDVSYFGYLQTNFMF